MALENIRKARVALNKSGGSELNATRASDMAEVAKEIQETLEKMHAAKLAAIKDAEAPFIKKLEELDASYAMMLSMMSTNDGSNE